MGNLAFSGGGGSTSSSTSTSEETTVVTTSDDPFGGGKTGSESLAEGGGIESTVTVDPQTTSVSEKYDGDPQGALDQMVDLAHDGNDGENATFDQVNNDEAGRQAINDSVESIVGATTTSTGSNDQQTPPDNTDQNRAADVVPEGVFPFGDGESDASGLFGAFVGAIMAVVSTVLSAVTGGN